MSQDSIKVLRILDKHLPADLTNLVLEYASCRCCKKYDVEDLCNGSNGHTVCEECESICGVCEDCLNISQSMPHQPAPDFTICDRCQKVFCAECREYFECDGCGEEICDKCHPPPAQVSFQGQIHLFCSTCCVIS